MDKRIAPGLVKNVRFFFTEVKEIMVEKQIKYVVAPSLGEKVIYAPDEWLKEQVSKYDNSRLMLKKDCSKCTAA